MPWLNHDGLVMLHHSDAEEEPCGLISTKRSWSRKWSSIVTHRVFFYNLLLFDVAFGKPLTRYRSLHQLQPQDRINWTEVESKAQSQTAGLQLPGVEALFPPKPAGRPKKPRL